MRFRSTSCRMAAPLLLAMVASGMAQDRMSDTLRKGVVEEDSKQNLSGAIKDYEIVMAQYDEARQTAATALFRLGECYRKQGNSAQAIAAYKRVAREFGDQTKLAEQSRTVLTGTYHVSQEPTKPSEQDGEQRKVSEARERYRATILEEIDLVNKQLERVEKSVKAALEPEADLDRLRQRVLELKRELAAFDAGIPYGSQH